MQDLRDLELTLNGPTPLLVIDSREELRILELFTRLGLRLQYPVFRWSVTEGLRRAETDFGVMTGTQEPAEVLRHIKATSQAGIYVLLDFHPYLNDPLLVRLVREIAQGYDQLARTLVFLSPDFDIPAELTHLSARVRLRLPDAAAMRRLVKEEAERWQQRVPGRRLRGDREALEKLASNLTGLTESDARRLTRSAIEDDGAITQSDLPEVMKAKYELLNRGGVISYEYDIASMADVAGLTRLKTWLDHRKGAFAGSNHRLDPPKGVLLLGVQGGGKSLAAKASAGLFGVPLLRLDFGALYDKYIGETEKNLRHALHTAQVMAPCVLWMDEIEKGLAGDEGEHGVSRRVLGTLLTWMAENRSRVFVVATANDIERLPPELLRKGRLDEIFFVDLPDQAARSEIFSIHLRQRNLAPSRFDLTGLAAATDGFSGAEIEQAVVASLYAADARATSLDSDLLFEEIETTRPLSVVMAEKIDGLRAWAATRTVPAH